MEKYSILPGHFRLFYCLLAGFLLLGGFSCSESDDPNGSIIEIPDARSFYMGFTAFPHDLTTEAVQDGYTNALENGDILLAHFDNGVPWNEALNDMAFPQQITNTIDELIQYKTAGHKIVLTATPTNQNRDGLANYWNNSGTHQPLDGSWTSYSFDSPEVVKAYISYCHRIIDSIEPDYFGFAIEINAGFLQNTDAFSAYINLADTVYRNLKQQYPTLPIFQSIQDQSFNKTREELLTLTREILPYTDMIAVSSYPFWHYDYPEQEANPSTFSDNWLEELRMLAPEKPFAISETGYCAEDLVMDEVGINVRSNPTYQRQFIQKLMKQANALDAEFLIWFIYQDYDELYNKIPEPPVIFKVWRDNGLLNGVGERRTGHDVWDAWKQLEIQ